MVLDKALDKAKEGTKEDKTAIAGGIAAFVVIILIVSWGFLFLKKMQRGIDTVDLRAGAQDQFNFSSVREAQEAIKESFEYSDHELKAIRDSAVDRRLPTGVEGFDTPNEYIQTDSDEFGTNLD